MYYTTYIYEYVKNEIEIERREQGNREEMDGGAKTALTQTHK